MSLKEWMVNNGCFDKNLLRVFPDYGVNEPDELKNLTPIQWKEIKTQQLRQRAAEMKNAAAKLRLEQKLNKIEKLWKAVRNPKAKRRKSKKSSRSLVPQKKKQKNSMKTRLNNLKEVDKASAVVTAPKTPKTPKVSMREMEDLRKRYKDVEKEKSQMMIEFNIFKKMHQTKIDVLNHQKLKMNSEWEEKYNLKETEFREIEKKYNKYKQLNYDHNNRKITIEAQLKDMSQKNEALTQLNQGLEDKLNANRTESEQITKEYTELQVKYEMIESEKKEFDSKQNELRDDMQQVKDYNKLLKQNLTELEEKNKEIKELSASYKEELTETDNKLSLKVKEFNHLQSKYEQVLDEYQQLKDENIVCEKTIQELQHSIDEEKNAKTETNESNHNAVGVLKQENVSLKERIDKMLQIEQDLNELIKKKTNRIKKLEKTNRELKDQDLKELDSNINHQEDLLRLQNEKEEYKHLYTKLKRKYDILYETTQEDNVYDINELITENKRLKERLKSKKKTAVLEDIVQNLDFPDDDREDEIDELREERDALKKLCNEMRIFIGENELSTKYDKHKTKTSKRKSRTESKHSKPNAHAIPNVRPKSSKHSKGKSRSESKSKRPRTEPKTVKKHKKKEKHHEKREKSENIVPETYITAFD